MTAAPLYVCGSLVKSKRGLLALGWSIVVVVTFIAFVTALVFSVQNSNYTSNYAEEDYENDDNGQNNKNNNKNAFSAVEIVVSSRAMAFAALWTAILATIMAIYGTIVLGVLSPSGTYYLCCSKSVHTTTPLSIGGFIGSLLMFANVTLVCSVLFSEFEVRDFYVNGNEQDGREDAEESVERSSTAFSVVCMFLTIVYAGFSMLVYSFSDELMEENLADERNDKLSPSDPEAQMGYIGGERFDVIHSNPRKEDSSGFIKPGQSEDTEESVAGRKK